MKTTELWTQQRIVCRWAAISAKPMVYSDVVARGLILPFKEKFTMTDVHEVMVGSLFTNHPGLVGTLSEHQAAFNGT